MPFTNLYQKGKVSSVSIQISKIINLSIIISNIPVKLNIFLFRLIYVIFNLVISTIEWTKKSFILKGDVTYFPLAKIYVRLDDIGILKIDCSWIILRILC